MAKTVVQIDDDDENDEIGSNQLKEYKEELDALGGFPVRRSCSSVFAVWIFTSSLNTLRSSL